jgi:hypothetical protein
MGGSCGRFASAYQRVRGCVLSLRQIFVANWSWPKNGLRFFENFKGICDVDRTLPKSVQLKKTYIFQYVVILPALPIS